MSAIRAPTDPTVPYVVAADDRTSASQHSDEHDQNDRKVLAHQEGERGTNHLDDAYWEPAEGVVQDDGVTRIEALYLVYGKGWGLFALWGSIGLISYAYALSQSTTYVYEQFAASSFGQHSLIGTISVITACADIFTRPWALAVAVVFYFVGYAVVAGAKNIESVAGGMVIYTLGNSGISFLQGLLVADITSLQWRGMVQGVVSLPFIPNAFVAGYITEGINGLSENGWRWGYGMFCILVPVLIAPALIVLFIGDRRAKKLGALSLAAPSYYRRQVLAGKEPEQPSLGKMLLHYWSRLNGFGLLLLGFAFGCILVPFTLSNTAQGGYKNPSLIAMLTVGGLLFFAWVAWDGWYAKYPIMPRRVFNRTFLACIAIDFFYYFSGYFVDLYWSSFVYVVVDWSDRNYQFYNNILTVGLCGLAVIAGFFQRYFHRYKYQQIFGLAVRCLGMGLTYAAARNPTDALLVTGRVVTSIGGAISVISSQVASQGSVPHQDLGIAIAVLSLWTNIGGAISQAISASVWVDRLRAKLTEYIGDTHNATEIQTIFGSILEARVAEPRNLVIQAYKETMTPLALAGFITSFLGLIAGLFTKDFRLGQEHNSVETHKIIRFRNKEEVDPKVIAAKARAVQEQIEKEVEEERSGR